jgi:hypothetical protein
MEERDRKLEGFFVFNSSIAFSIFAEWIEL